MKAQEIPFGKIEDEKIILNAWSKSPERVIGEVRENDEKTSIQYFVSKYEDLVEKIQELEKEIEISENKGSYLMKLIHLRSQLSEHDGLGDYQKLEDQLTKQENLLNDIINKNRDRNSEIKQALLKELRTAEEKINWREATEEIHDIKNRWIKTGNAKEEDEEVFNEEFWSILERFFDKKKQFYEDKKLLGEKHKKNYEALILKANQVADLHGRDRLELIKNLKSEWSENGNIPKEEYTPLLKEFNNKLKATSAEAPTVNLNELHSILDGFLNGEHYHFKMLEEYKKSLKALKVMLPEEKKLKREAFGKLQILLERDFIDKLAKKRFNDFNELEKPKKKSIRVGILEELLGRDKADLAKFEENSSNFSGGTTSAISLIEKKLSQQKMKISTKESLLKMLKEDK